MLLRVRWCLLSKLGSSLVGWETATVQVTEEQDESGAFLRTEAKEMQLPLQSIGQGKFPDAH